MSKDIRLLIIDDSSYNRKIVSSFFDRIDSVEVVGKAADGQEGLQMVNNLEPTVITLDIEMPKLDGFSFLRLLMASRPTPVIVISSHTKPENIMQALELGALDFVAKPGHLLSAELENIKGEVIKKVTTASKYNLKALERISTSQLPQHVTKQFDSPNITSKSSAANNIIVIGASTGGPASLVNILTALPADLNASIIVTQHMPPNFTASFAKRLNKLCALTVCEQNSEEVLQTGKVYVTPGDADLIIEEKNNKVVVKKVAGLPDAKYHPSIDRLFLSASKINNHNVLALVLTGMGSDGAAGTEAIYDAGGTAMIEDPNSCVIDSMPRAVLERGVLAKQRVPGMISSAIETFCKK